MSNDDLWDPSDHVGMRQRIEKGTIEEWQRVLPAEYGGVRLEANNLRFTGKDRYSLAEQKKAWMENRELGRSLKADLALYDAKTGDLLDTLPELTLMKVPHFTDRGTFVYNGNNYTAASQARLMPGPYTRRQANGNLETQFNTRTGTGKVFRVGLEPDTGQFRLKVAGSNLHLYSVLKDAGVSDAEIEERWGPEVLELNRQKYDARAIGKAFQKMVPKYLQGQVQDGADRGALLLDALNKAQVSKAVTDRTLSAYWKTRSAEKTAGRAEIRNLVGMFFKKKTAADGTYSAGFDIRSTLGDRDDEGDEYRGVGIDGLMAATDKLLAVNRGLDKPDDRSIPTFTKIYTMDKLMRERIRFDEGKLRRNLLRMVASRKNLSPFHHRIFDPYYKEIITKNPLTTPIEETNPLQLVGQQRRITHMGPGGIGSLDAVTPEMNAIQANEMGYYSVLEGPECHRQDGEVYTLRGWVPWPEVKDDDWFACRIEGRLQFCQADRVIRQSYSGPLIVAEHETLLMAVTPNHRVLYTKNPSAGYKVGFASELNGQDLKLPIRHLPMLGREDWTEFQLPEEEKTNSNQRKFGRFRMDDWCALVGWWLAEGSSCARRAKSNGGSPYITHTIDITRCPAANPENHREIQDLLIRMGLLKPGGKVHSKFTIGAKQLVAWFSRWQNGCCDKWIPEELFEAPVSARRAMLDALLKGDRRYNAKRWSYCSVSLRLALSVERLAISLGYPAFICVEKDSRAHVKTTNYVVSIHRQYHRQILGRAYTDKRSGKAYGGNWRTEEYNGMVYCATVPGGFMFVRGKASTSGYWSGNSGAAGVDVRLSWGVKVGSDGRMRRELLNRRTGQKEMVSPDQLYDRFLKLPD